MTTLHLRKSIARSPLRLGLFLIPFALCCFALAPMAQAVSPPPDGGYPSGNTAEGQNALFSLSTGGFNTAVGFLSLQSNRTNSLNTAVGAGTLLATTADGNTASGAGALLSNTAGAQNTANGAFALFSNTMESFNTANGFEALFSNTGAGGHHDVATGYQALFSNITGRRNVANGSTALFSNTTGNFNVAVGDQALYSNTIGSFNTAVGLGALFSNNTGDANGASTAIGNAALTNNTTGEGNTAIGASALVNSLTGNQNIALGYVAAQNLTDGSNNIDISNPVVPTESNIIRIGNVVPFTDIYGFPHAAHTATFIAGIANATVSGSAVYVDTTSGQLGLLSSSERFKDGIKPMGEASEALLSLRPVTFRYKKNIDPKGGPQFGLVAEEVEKVNPDLVVRDAEGKVFTVRYEAVNAMLLNEFLKEHRKVEQQGQRIQEQDATIAQLKSGMEALTATVKEQAAQIQKVSAQLGASQPAPQVVKNDQ